jgi:hypothetical protein
MDVPRKEALNHLHSMFPASNVCRPAWRVNPSLVRRRAQTRWSVLGPGWRMHRLECFAMPPDTHQTRPQSVAPHAARADG